MSKVVPFRALRPGKPAVRQVAAPPYDVLNVAEAREMVRHNPLSFLHVEKSEIDLPDAAGVEDRRIYERAKENLEALIHQGILAQEESVAFSLYPPTVAQMMAVADAGKVMPPKSTWFEPKLLSGLFVHRLD